MNTPEMNSRICALAAVCVTLVGCAPPPIKIDASPATFETGRSRAQGEGLQRAARSEARLIAAGIRVNSSLPMIEESATIDLRSPEEVAGRAVALSVVSERAAGHGDTYALGQSLLDKHGVREYLTPKERNFMADRTPSERDKIQMSWRIEAAVPLLWALNLLPVLDRPRALAKFDVIKTIRTIDLNRAKLLALRAKSQVLDETDLIYRYHWAVVDARVNGGPAPIEVDAGIVQERHHALNWLIRYENQDWDDVTTDT